MKNDRMFWESGVKNTQSFQYYYYALLELAISMFEYKNLPDTVDERFLELALFSEGKAVFFEDDIVGYLALRVNPCGELNEYGIPTLRYAYGENGYQSEPLTIDNSVIIYNNYMRMPSRYAILRYAQRLCDLDSTIDVNVKAQKTPILISCDEKQRLTMLNLYKKYDGNEPYIFGDKSINPQSLQVLNTNAPYVSDKVYMLKNQIWNEALTYLGISNISVDKKERLIVDEVTRNQGGTMAFRQTRIAARKQALKQINKMFGLNIDVEYRKDYQIIENDGDKLESEETAIKEGAYNE